MKLTIDEINEINRIIGKGSPSRISSLEFALDLEEKDWRIKLAHLLRAIVVDHAYSDGCKSTGYVITLAYFKKYDVKINPNKIEKLMIKLAKDSPRDRFKIRRMIRNAEL